MRPERGDRRSPPHPPERPGVLAEAGRQRHHEDGRHPAAPGRHAPPAGGGQRQHQRQAPHVERVDPPLAVPRGRDRLDPRPILGAVHPEHVRPDQLDDPVRLHAEVVDVHRAVLGHPRGPGGEFQDRQELRRGQRRRQRAGARQARQHRPQPRPARAPSPSPGDRDADARPGREHEHPGRRGPSRPGARGRQGERGRRPHEHRPEHPRPGRQRTRRPRASIASTAAYPAPHSAVRYADSGSPPSTWSARTAASSAAPSRRPWRSSRSIAQPPGDPRSADEEDHVAVLRQDRRPERIAQPSQQRPRPAHAERAAQRHGAQQRQRRVRDDVGPCAPGVGQRRVDDLARVEHRGHRVAEQGGAGVQLGRPQRHPPGGPLLLDAQVERVVEVGRVAVGELLVAEQCRAEADEREGQRAGQSEQGQGGAAHRTALGIGVRPASGSVPASRGRPPIGAAGPIRIKGRPGRQALIGHPGAGSGPGAGGRLAMPPPECILQRVHNTKRMLLSNRGLR